MCWKKKRFINNETKRTIKYLFILFKDTTELKIKTSDKMSEKRWFTLYKKNVWKTYEFEKNVWILFKMSENKFRFDAEKRLSNVLIYAKCVKHVLKTS